VPSAQAFLPVATSPHARRVRELLARDQRLALEPGRKLLAKHGVQVVEGAPGASLDQVLRARRSAA
jgi:hypothetical protein